MKYSSDDDILGFDMMPSSDEENEEIVEEESIVPSLTPIVVEMLATLLLSAVEGTTTVWSTHNFVNIPEGVSDEIDTVITYHNEMLLDHAHTIGELPEDLGPPQPSVVGPTRLSIFVEDADNLCLLVHVDQDMSDPEHHEVVIPIVSMFMVELLTNMSNIDVELGGALGSKKLTYHKMIRS
jgi:hypothetical protein